MFVPDHRIGEHANFFHGEGVHMDFCAERFQSFQRAAICTYS